MNVINQVIAVLSLFVLAVSGCDRTNPEGDYCYRDYTSDDGFIYLEYECVCPWSTCERNSNIVSPLYDCKITGFSIAFIVVGSVLTCVGIGLCIFCCVKCCCNKPSQQPVQTVGQLQVAQPVYVTGAAQPQAYPNAYPAAYPPASYPPPQCIGAPMVPPPQTAA